MKSLSAIFILFLLYSCSNSSTDTTNNLDSSAIEPTLEVDVLDTTGGKGVFFETLHDSQIVKSPIKIKMGLKGMEVEAAGPINQNKGHHHIIIDGTTIDEGLPIPLDETHIHFGKGQTETELNLTPGPHTLTLQFANGVHASYGHRWGRSITVIVK